MDALWRVGEKMICAVWRAHHDWIDKNKPVIHLDLINVSWIDKRGRLNDPII